MQTYFFTVASVALIGGLIVAIAPASSSKRYVRLICSLGLTLCVMKPIITLAMDIADGEIFSELDGVISVEQESDYDEIYNSTLLSAEKKNAENALKNEIIQALSAKDDAIDISIELCEKSDVFYISAVEVLIHPSGLALDPRDIEKCILERVECECWFVYVE